MQLYDGGASQELLAYWTSSVNFSTQRDMTGRRTAKSQRQSICYKILINPSVSGGLVKYSTFIEKAMILKHPRDR